MAVELQELLERAPRVGVVFDQHDATRRQLPDGGQIRLRLGGYRRRREGQPDRERAAPARALAFGADPAAVEARELADDREADAEATARAVERPRRLGEQLEHARKELRGDPGSIVAHAHFRCIAMTPYGDVDPPASRRELARVVDEVRDDLLDTRRVRVDREGIRAQREVDPVPIETAADAHARDGPLDGLPEVDVPSLK